MELDKQKLKQISKIVLSAVVLYCVLQNLNSVFKIINEAFSILFPFILGAIIAFILNLPMGFYERILFKPKKVKGKIVQSKFKRPVSAILSIVTITIILTIIISLVIPELINTVKLLIENIPSYIDATEDFFTGLADEYPYLSDLAQNIKIDEEKLQNNLINLTGNVMTFSINTVKGLFSSIIKVFISLVFAIYILANKNNLKTQAKKLAYAYLQKEKADKLLKISNLSEKTFKSFISGQVIEASILGLLCAIGMTIFKIPYAVTIGVLIAFTALIPIVGAFVGGFIGALLIVTVAPTKAIIFIIFLIILQQLEGNLIYPKVVGKSIGLPGMWVLLAITVGGSLLGVLGMLVAVPTMAVIYTLLKLKTENQEL